MGARAFEDVRRQLGASRRELVALLGVEETEVACAFLGGSIAEGLGNPRSDVDVYLIVESVEPFRAREEELKSLRLGERIVAPALFSLSSVQRACEQAAAGGELSAAEIDLLHRIGSGIPLLHEAAFEGLREQLPRKALAALMVRNGEAMLANLFDDVIGTLEANDLATCAFNARTLIDCAMDAYLAMHGDTLAREKWRYRKIERTLGAGDSLAQRYLGLASCVRFEGEEAFGYVERCLDLYQQIETRLVASALHPAFPAILSCAAPAGRTALRRNPLVKMAHEPDGALILIERNPLFRLLAPYSLVWLSIGSADGAGTAKALAAAGGHDGADLDEVHARCVAEWSSAELLVPC